MDEQPRLLSEAQLDKRSSRTELREINERLLISALREQELSIALEAERARLEAILSSIGDAVLVVDREGKPVLTNAAYAQMTSDAAAAKIIEDATNLMVPLEDEAGQMVARSETFTFEFSTIAPDSTRWWEAKGRLIGQEPGIQGTVVVIRDVSAHKL